MADDAITQIVDILASPYIFGLPVEKQIPVQKRRAGELFALSLLTLREKKYPATHKDSSGNGYIYTRAFASVQPSSRSPKYGVVVWSGKGYDIYTYDEMSVRLQLVERNIEMDSKNPSTARKNFLAALRASEKFSNSDIFSVNVLVNTNNFAPRDSQIISDGDIEADAYD